MQILDLAVVDYGPENASQVGPWKVHVYLFRLDTNQSCPLLVESGYSYSAPNDADSVRRRGGGKTTLWFKQYSLFMTGRGCMYERLLQVGHLNFILFLT